MRDIYKGPWIEFVSDALQDVIASSQLGEYNEGSGFGGEADDIIN